MELNDLMDAVTRRLEVLFPGCTIYTDAVEQGLSEPCFFVNVLEPSRKPMLGRRSFQQNQFCIQYIPAAGEGRPALYRVLSVLLDQMEYILLTDGSVLRGTERNGRVEDGVLNFFVCYNLFLICPAVPDERMDMLEVKGGGLRE